MIEHLGERAQCDVFQELPDATLERCTRVYDHKGAHNYPSSKAAKTPEAEVVDDPEPHAQEVPAPQVESKIAVEAPIEADIDEDEPTNVEGRPSKYTDDIPAKLIDYFMKPVVEKIETVTSGSNGKGSEWSKTEVRYEALFFPTLELFAQSIDVDVSTLTNWAGRFPSNYRDEALAGTLRHPEFFHAYTRIKDLQKGHLVQNALIGKLNPGFAQFFAINNLGMQSKSVVEENIKHTYEELDDDQLDAAIEARKNRAT